MCRRVLKLREKNLVILIFAFFTLACFGGTFFLPDFWDLGGSEKLSAHVPVRMFVPDAGAHGQGVDGDVHKKDDSDRLWDKIRKNFLAKPPLTVRRDEEQFPVTPSPLPANPSLNKKKSDGVGGGGGPSVGRSADDEESKMRRMKIVQMMQHAWSMYEKHAWGENELKPISKRGHSANIFGHSKMGATIVDGLDTLYLMGLTEEFARGRQWVKESFRFEANSDISVFEVNIRFVGGLLACYALSKDAVFKDKAVEIADKLLPAFETETGIPYAILNLQTGSRKNWSWASGGCSILSEFGTLHLEFAYLSNITGNPVYLQKVTRIREYISKMERQDGVYPNYLHPSTGRWGQRHTSLGALGDSFYEYLLKSWLQNKTDALAKSMYDEAMKTVMDRLLQTSRNGLVYFAEMKNGRLEHKMDHLACFTGGMIGLGAEHSDDKEKHMKVAKDIGKTCYESYDRTATKLGPEAFRFEDSSEATTTRSQEKYYILRPEVIETYFYLWRLTKNNMYREWGWQAAQALEKHCLIKDGGYTGIKDVYDAHSAKDDVQQSFFLAETLKYLYLLFSPDSTLDLDRWVLNTEAHPLPVLV
ncbi:hypothetical protein HELRODRAFT_87481 [Helobdella robusta]|uniref:alpha-1,2-Mannosidase n=1 Tax=Helobdella robusta TaxID=6412 RepID=T1G6Q8_HELRO|nr:hypothetical protein HELRODRAFT_87481 [Helobdella robusta]ESN94889.1 hypothetical protein HELRODRAFT_87481 [Helobdella robusta]